MTPDDVRIRDLTQRHSKEWIPPIGAMGAPLSHLLYRDLVLHAGLRLFRDREGRPWLEMQDGGSRRMFPIPSTDLRTALDRFRMRRNVRPVSANDLNDFARICEARVSDPDIEIPFIEPPVGSQGAPPTPPPAPQLREGTESIKPAAEPVKPPGGPSPASWVSLPSVRKLVDNSLQAAQKAGERPPDQPSRPGPDLVVSGGYVPFKGQLGGPHRYVRTLRELTQNGGWLGTSEELARRTGDHPESVAGWIERYRAALLQHNLVVTPVELEDGWRWLAFDRGRKRRSSGHVRASSPSKSGAYRERAKRRTH